MLHGGDDLQRGRGNFGGSTCPTSLILLIIANWTGPCSGMGQGQTFNCKRWTTLLSAAKWAMRLQSAGEGSTIALFFVLKNIAKLPRLSRSAKKDVANCLLLLPAKHVGPPRWVIGHYLNG